MVRPTRPLIVAGRLGLGAVALSVALVAPWLLAPATHDAVVALGLTTGIGILAWSGATLVAPRPAQPPVAANDNLPYARRVFDWRPVTDAAAAYRAVSATRPPG